MRSARRCAAVAISSNVATVPEQTRTGPVYSPAVDIFENESSITLLADMPGAQADSVQVRLEGGQLTLEAERALTSEASIRYLRMFRVPTMADPNGISAELKNGVLHVHLKKSEAAKPRTIPIRAS